VLRGQGASADLSSQSLLPSAKDTAPARACGCDVWRKTRAASTLLQAVTCLKIQISRLRVVQKFELWPSDLRHRPVGCNKERTVSGGNIEGPSSSIEVWPALLKPSMEAK